MTGPVTVVDRGSAAHPVHDDPPDPPLGPDSPPKSATGYAKTDINGCRVVLSTGSGPGETDRCSRGTSVMPGRGGNAVVIAVRAGRSPAATREAKAPKSRPKGIVVIREKASRGSGETSAKGPGTPLARKATPGRQEGKPR
jgi:hypothetical protein